MYCQKCGTQIPDGSAFCPLCGEGVRDIPGSPCVMDDTPQYAGFLIRLVAWFIDNIILSVISVILFIPFFAFYPIFNPARFYTGLMDLWAIIALILSIIIPYLYYAGFESSSRQATIGKSVLGLIVTDTDGRRLTFGRATLRYIGRIVVGFTLGLGYLPIIFTEKKQGLHDFIADTVVITKRV